MILSGAEKVKFQNENICGYFENLQINPLYFM